jgi:hypothetical protein
MTKRFPAAPIGCDVDSRGKVKCGKQENLDDWAANLVTKQNDVVLKATSKSERIDKRLAKKRRAVAIKSKLRSKRGKTLQTSFSPAVNEHDEEGLPVVAQQLSVVNDAANTMKNDRIRSSCAPQFWRSQLTVFSNRLETCLQAIKKKRKSWQKPYCPVPPTSNYTSKRRRQQVANKTEDWVQPRRSNYGGIGLARPSLLISLDDPSWQAKLEEEFSEHIPGFYGKQRTKAMKKQLDGQMLWRQLQKQKVTGSSAFLSRDNPNQITRSGKKLAKMKPDERVEALIQAGYV